MALTWVPVTYGDGRKSIPSPEGGLRLNWVEVTGTSTKTGKTRIAQKQQGVDCHNSSPCCETTSREGYPQDTESAKALSAENGLVRITRFPCTPGSSRFDTFFVHCIVPSRTLFPDNLYTTVLQAADQSKSVQCALRALSASYLGDPAGLALRYQALCDLAKGRLTEIETVAIHLTLLQASIIDEQLFQDWKAHVHTLTRYRQTPMRDTQAWWVKLASHAILANASAIAKNAFPSMQLPKCDLIDPMIGLSPSLLRIIQKLNEVALTSPSNRVLETWKLLEDLKTLEQSTLDQTGQPERKQVIRATAETYRQAAVLYALYRCLRKPVQQRDLKSTQDNLLNLISSLPCEGDCFTALWPLWSLFVLSVASRFDQKQRILEVWDKLDRSSSRSNVPPVSKAARWILETRHKGDSWDARIGPYGPLSLT